MKDPSGPLQVALHDALRADAAVAALVGGRIYDAVPADAVFPYVAIGEAQTVDDGAACLDAAECFVTLHVWSRVKGAVEARRITSAVAAALDDAAFDLSPDHVLVEIASTGARTFLDPDGLTTHGVVTIRALTESL
ncbi:DUF3168 domain-containing protein [Xanthobacter sediminis]